MKIEKFGKLLANLFYKNKYVNHIKTLKQAWKHRLVSKEVHRVIRFNQKVWPKPFIHMNTDLKKQQKITLRKAFSSWWIMQFLEKPLKMWENPEISNL